LLRQFRSTIGSKQKQLGILVSSEEAPHLTIELDGPVITFSFESEMRVDTPESHGAHCGTQR
jgi:hypothetical protein